jgi:hypothetical protein
VSDDTDPRPAPPPGVGGGPTEPESAAPGAPEETLSPDETTVRDTLRALPSRRMPEDVAARIDAALRAAPPLPLAGATVVPLAAARERQQRRLAWSGRAVSAAAGVAAVLVVSGVVVSQLSSGGGGSASTALSAGTSGAAADMAGPVVRSGTNYTDQRLPEQLNTVLVSAVSGQTPTTAGQESVGGPSSSPTPTPTPTSPQQPDQPAAKVLTYTPALQACVLALTNNTPVDPLAADYARYDSRAVLVIAIPGRSMARTVEVFVVPRDCAGGPNLQLFYYRVVDVTDLPALAGVDLPSPAAS